MFKKHLWVFWLVSSLWCCVALAQSAGSSSLGDPLYSYMGNGGYDALDYTIALRFSDDKKTVVGTTNIEAVATQDLASFNLDFGAMTVSNVVVGGVAARFSQADPEMTVVPASPLKKGEKFKVGIVYSGAPSTKLAVASAFGQWAISPMGLMVHAEPSQMFLWSPVNDHPADKATFTLQLTASRQNNAIANGELRERRENSDGSVTSTYRIGTPTATYFVMLAVGSWQVEEGGKVGNTRIRHYLALHTESSLRQAVEETKSIVEFFSQKLTPYPFSEVGVLTTDTPEVYALETQSLVVIPTSYYEGDYLGQVELIAHEFAHQWFGALVTFKNHEDMFIHEGFAEYLSRVYMNEVLGNYVGSDSLERDLKTLYPSMVHQRTAEVYDHSRLVQILRNRLGTKILSAQEVGKALDLLFGQSLPASTRTAILARVSSTGWSSAQLIEAIDALPFERIVLVYQNLIDVRKLTNGKIDAFFLAPNWDQFTPPAALKLGDNPFNKGVYYRGAMSNHALRLRLGNDKFWKLLSAFLEQYKFSNASVDDWLALVEKTAGREVRAFHQTWLRDPVVPDFPELGLKKSDFKLGADFK
jgi:aminopeptidase N